MDDEEPMRGQDTHRWVASGESFTQKSAMPRQKRTPAMTTLPTNATAMFTSEAWHPQPRMQNLQRRSQSESQEHVSRKHARAHAPSCCLTRLMSLWQKESGEDRRACEGEIQARPHQVLPPLVPLRELNFSRKCSLHVECSLVSGLGKGDEDEVDSQRHQQESAGVGGQAVVATCTRVYKPVKCTTKMAQSTDWSAAKRLTCPRAFRRRRGTR